MQNGPGQLRTDGSLLPAVGNLPTSKHSDGDSTRTQSIPDAPWKVPRSVGRDLWTRRLLSVSTPRLGDTMEREAMVLKALAERTRLRLVVLLATQGELCVCALAGAIEELDCDVSRHLSVLRAAGLVESRREKTWDYYRLSDSLGMFAERLIDTVRNLLGTRADAREDIRRLRDICCE